MFVHKFILSIIGLFLLSGCGFRPLYEATSTDVQSHLSHIKIQTIADREGQILHNKLSTLLAPHRASQAPLYTLTTSLVFGRRGIAIQKDASTSQEAIDLTFHITLDDLKTGRTLYSTSETLSVDNSVSVNSPYSNIVEERSARKRLAEEAAHSIRLHLASFFSSQSEGA